MPNRNDNDRSGTCWRRGADSAPLARARPARTSCRWVGIRSEGSRNSKYRLPPPKRPEGARGEVQRANRPTMGADLGNSGRLDLDAQPAKRIQGSWPSIQISPCLEPKKGTGPLIQGASPLFRLRSYYGTKVRDLTQALLRFGLSLVTIGF